VLIQKRVRLYQAYQLCGPFLREKRGSWQRFRGIWRGAIAAIEEAVVLGHHVVEASWTEAKADCDMYSTLRLDDRSSSSPSSTGGGNSDDPLMQELMSKAAVVDINDVVDDDDGDDDSDSLAAPTASNASQRPRNSEKPTAAPASTIELSQAVTKWLDKADAKYRQLFCRRMEQLAGGYRSYALSKRLGHCRHPIYESKLDAGQRILWTKLRRGEPHEQRYSILVRAELTCIINNDSYLFLLLLNVHNLCRSGS
jgi:hypothetical protein